MDNSKDSEALVTHHLVFIRFRCPVIKLFIFVMFAVNVFLNKTSSTQVLLVIFLHWLSIPLLLIIVVVDALSRREVLL